MSSLRTGSGGLVAPEALWLSHFWQRGLGWIGKAHRPELALGIPLTEGERVHTVGVRFALELAFCDSTGRVLRVLTLAPNRLGPSVLGACVVWEWPAGAAPRVGEGEVLRWR